MLRYPREPACSTSSESYGPVATQTAAQNEGCGFAHGRAEYVVQDDRADLLTRLNAKIEDHVANVGRSFLMRDLAGTGLQAVWRYEILPVLAEHHYGEGVDLEARYGLVTLHRQATRDAPDVAGGASTAMADIVDDVGRDSLHYRSGLLR
ncbi:hypothetical protein KK092_15615 [Curtobacterium flaccumfaciens pv. flaccumfaciens]|uniref:hypothetical protein n=1 Tax=Curtobacterium flaccumfaciens TaxID=2035 RepID=UPI001BDE5169|nr:hypothetical protein [Curtobacterium flaccumfaciens]MBT1670810.1 hypothetical protein [Curtobacterium flaccumfaciens pv. flaccumfaciens]